MRSSLSHRLIAVALFSGFLGVLTGAVWFWGYGSALDQLARRGRSDLALAADRLTSELQSFRELAALVSDHPVVGVSLAGWDPKSTLAEIADKTGALDVTVSNTAGEVLASARGIATPQVDRYGFKRAMSGALGVDHYFSEPFGRRVFTFTSPVFDAEGPVIGAVTVTVDVEAIEASWRGDRPAVLFTDESEVVFVSNRSELVFRSRSSEAALTAGNDGYRADDIEPFFDYESHMRGPHEIWSIDGGRYLPNEALHLTLNMPTVGLTGEALLDVAPARQIAGLQAAVAAALSLAFGAMLFLATERRRTLARANQLLEARLKKAQDDLVQAGKLSALGQMSAGISHELNQPLMAIRSFAENAEAFLERGNPERAAENLNRISELVRRMGRIIRNLRAFSRQESEPLTDVEVGAVIEAAMEMAATKARQEGAVLHWEKTEAPIWVRAGEVRLQQVVLNLISNAIDAMEGQDDKAVHIDVIAGDRVTVSVRDTGPGIAEPEKIFDPFYSTKQVGAAEGMGLGLSISYGLVQSFGGAIRGRNHPDGGAIFTVELDATKGRDAA